MEGIEIERKLIENWDVKGLEVLVRLNSRFNEVEEIGGWEK